MAIRNTVVEINLWIFNSDGTRQEPFYADSVILKAILGSYLAPAAAGIRKWTIFSKIKKCDYDFFFEKIRNTSKNFED